MNSSEFDSNELFVFVFAKANNENYKSKALLIPYLFLM